MPIFDGDFSGVKVDTSDPGFQRKLAWVHAQLKGQLEWPTLRVFTTWNPKEESRLAQGVYVWSYQSTVVEIPAFDIQKTPTAVVTDIDFALNLPFLELPLPETWEEFESRTSPTPVGDPIPGTPRQHSFAAGHDSAHWPEGSTATKAINGRTVTFIRRRKQVKPGEGPMGTGGVFEPIWEMFG